VFYILFN